LIAQRNAHANYRLLKTLKTFFRWCVGRAVIDFSPAEGISSPYREVSRDRVLTDQELAAVILAARLMPPPYGRIVEFLALTGQRREEVAQLKWDELDDETRMDYSGVANQEQESPHRSSIGAGLEGDRSVFGRPLRFWHRGRKALSAFRKRKAGA
jgi:integrase